MPVLDQHHRRSQAASQPIRPIMMYELETWAAPFTVTERLKPTGIVRRTHVLWQGMKNGRHQHLALLSKVATEHCLRYFVHMLRRPAHRLVQ
ncbi:hypothetical protein RB195_019075 [Necator americanus]